MALKGALVVTPPSRDSARELKNSANLNLVVCYATEVEGSLLRQRLSPHGPVALVRTGVGLVNAAHAVTLTIARYPVSAIVICGVGGAYPESGLAVGDVVCASAESYADFGVSTPDGFMGTEALGFPSVESIPPLYNTLPLNLFPTPARVSFATVACSTGTRAAAHSMESRTGAAVENMEGAAIVHVAHLHGIAVGEIRGISNEIGDRDIRGWRLKEAAIAAQEVLQAWIVKL